MLFEATHHRSPGSAARLAIDARRIILTDEAVSYRFSLTATESRDTTSIVLQQRRAAEWLDGGVLWVPGKPVAGEGTLRLTEGVTAIRCRITPARGKQTATESLLVDTRAPLPVLVLLSMGGAWTGSPATPSGPPGSQARLEEHGIRVDEDRCRLRGIPSELIRTLTTNRNIQCNDLCDEDCVNFLEHLGLRLMNDEALARELKSIRQDRYCNVRPNPSGIDNTIIVGKWENSELEPVRPPGIRTWEQILDDYRSRGGRHVILVGQSHGCAKFAGMARDHWRWGNDLTVDLFVSWDGADLGGGVSSVGPRPETVLAFFQRGDAVNWQNGQHIEQATEEHDLTGLFSHNAIARSRFVHDKTVTFIRDAIASVRARTRGGNAVTFRIDEDGSLGERTDTLRLAPNLTLARALRIAGEPHLFLAAQSGGSTQVRRIDAHGIIDTIVSTDPLPPGFTAATFFTVGGITHGLFVKEADEESLIVRIRPDAAFGQRTYPNSTAERLSGPLRGPWDLAESFRVGNSQFVAVARADGTIRTARVDDGGRPVAAIPGPIFGLGRLSSMVFYATSSGTYLFTAGDGLSVYRVGADGTIGARIWQEATLGPAASGVACHLRAGDNSSLVMHDLLGNLLIRRIEPNGLPGATLFNGRTGRTGRQALSSYEVEGRGYLVLLQRPS
jgi:hypothetical protein